MAPAIALMLKTPKGLSFKERLYRTFCCKTMTKKENVDTEIAGIVMLLEIPLVRHLCQIVRYNAVLRVVKVLGFCVPLLFPLLCASMYFHATVFKWSNLPLKGCGMPATRYLWVSIALGVALEVWLYYEARMHGLWIIIAGCPVAALCMLGFARTSSYREWCQSRTRMLEAMPAPLDTATKESTRGIQMNLNPIGRANRGPASQEPDQVQQPRLETVTTTQARPPTNTVVVL